MVASRRGAMIVSSTTFPPSEASWKWNCASRAWNSAAEVAGSPIRCSRAAACSSTAARSGTSADAASRLDCVSSSTRVLTTSATGRDRVAMCIRSAQPRAAEGSEITVAPDCGPEPVAERTRPMAARMRTASRTEAREMPKSSARVRSAGSLSPTRSSPARSCRSSQSSTTV